MHLRSPSCCRQRPRSAHARVHACARPDLHAMQGSGTLVLLQAAAAVAHAVHACGIAIAVKSMRAVPVLAGMHVRLRPLLVNACRQRHQRRSQLLLPLPQTQVHLP